MEVLMLRRAVPALFVVLFLSAAPAVAFDVNLAVGADFGGDFSLRCQCQFQHRLQPGVGDCVQRPVDRARGRARIWVLT